MTTEKARKRAIRTRMAKTGERYAAARRQVGRPDPPVTDDLGMSDEAIRRRTGRGWKEWIRLLDAWDATENTHRDIARHVHDEHGVDGWSAQAVAVGYERARGLRDVHQKADGYCAYASKTYPVDALTLSKAFTEARRRNRWLEPGTLRVPTSTPGRSARFDVGDGDLRLVAWFTEKGESKSIVHLEVDRLGGPDDVEREKAFWKERLAVLADALRPPARSR
jgi:hypothetical protein